MTHLNISITDLQAGSDADGIWLHEVAPFLKHCHGQKPLAHAIARHHGHVDAYLNMSNLGRLRLRLLTLRVRQFFILLLVLVPPRALHWQQIQTQTSNRCVSDITLLPVTLV